MNPNAKLIDTMRTLTFGVEIETVGISRRALATAVATACPGSTVSYEGTGYDKWIVTLADGRKWTCMSDASLTGSTYSGEVVTPICTWADLEAIQDVVRALRKAGARVNESCGVHVHVGAPADRFDAPALTRLAKLVYSQENLIVKALDVAGHRLGHYTKPVDEAFIRDVAARRPGSREALATAWYTNVAQHTHTRDASCARTQHYHGSRYRGLNMHSVFFRGTVEFRYFQPTLHAGQIKAYVQFCLALATKALAARSAVARKRTFNAATAKYDFRVLLLRLGLIGPEFATARLHLMAHLEGSSSYKHGSPGAAAPAAPPSAPSAPETFVALVGADGFTARELASLDAYVAGPHGAPAAPSVAPAPAPAPTTTRAPAWL